MTKMANLIVAQKSYTHLSKACSPLILNFKEFVVLARGVTS